MWLQTWQVHHRPGLYTTSNPGEDHEKQVDAHHIFVDYNPSFDKAKLIRLCRKTLSNSCNSVKVGLDLSEHFDTVRGFRQLSCDLFNFVMESVLRKARVHPNGTIFHKSVQLLTHVDEIDIIGRTKRNVTAAFGVVEREFTKMGPAVNEGKTKYILLASRDMSRIGSQNTADNYTFNIVKQFIYLGSAVTRITLANRC